VGPSTDLDETTEQAERFAAIPGLLGVVGHAGSRISILAASVYNARGISQIVPNATSRRLAIAGPWTFRLVPDDGIEGAALASYALDSLGLSRVTVMYIGDEYGTGLRDGVDSVVRARGLVLTDHVLVPSRPCQSEDRAELTSVLARASVRRAAPEVVILAVTTPVAACLARAVAAERPGVWFLGADGVEPAGGILNALPPEVRERFRTVIFGLSTDSATQLFLARSRRILGRDPVPSEALVYDGYMLLAAAAEATGGSREAVRRWLVELGRSRPAWQGVTGPIGFAGPRRELIRFVSISGTAP
jgi:ABC-type branched-subunit amino acid transport system substrate-binding protein